MSNDVKSVFLSSNNLQFTYNQVKNEVYQSTSYDISKKRNLKTVFNQMANSVYDKTNSNEKNLVFLNDKLVASSKQYFVKILQKKQEVVMASSIENITSQNSMPNLQTQYAGSQYNQELGMSMKNDIKDLNSELEKLNQERNNDIINNQPNDKMLPPSMAPVPTNESNHDLDVRYQSIMNKRHNPLSNENNDLKNSVDDNNLFNKININSSNNNSSNNNSSNNKTQNEESINVLPFTLSDDFESYSQNASSPLYSNVSTLKSQDNMSTKDLLKQYEDQRNSLNCNLQTQPKNKDFDKLLKDVNLDSMTFDRESEILESRQRNAQADPRILLEAKDKFTNDLVSQMDENTIGDNTRDLSRQDFRTDKVIKQVLNYQIENAPKYIEKTHFISINSLDRKWETTTTETRYNYKVAFKGSSNSGSASIPNILKNVVYVEPVSLIMPNDSEIVPFDNRIFLNTLHYPYLILNIDELKGVFNGTNNTADQAFSHMIFDKDYGSNTISTNTLATFLNTTDNTGNTVSNNFETQFVKTFYRFTPAYFERKNFYNSPLASLNSLTISLTDPYGNKVNNQPDVLTSKNIAMKDIENSKLIDGTAGFPRTAITETQKIKITTTTFFSNRLFKIGDKIRINATSDNTAFNTFLNRDEGHVIINLDVEGNANNANTANKGFINALYISPPGTIDTSTGGLTAGSYHATVGTITAGGKLINESLQTHLLFKVVTRDTDTEEIVRPLNV